MILCEVEEGKAKPFGFSTMQHKVQRMRVKLEEAELTDGQGRALSAHRTQQSYIGYAKRTEKRVLAATRKRHAHRLVNEMATDVQNEQQKTVQTEAPEQSAISK